MGISRIIAAGLRRLLDRLLGRPSAPPPHAPAGHAADLLLPVPDIADLVTAFRQPVADLPQHFGRQPHAAASPPAAPAPQPAAVASPVAEEPGETTHVLSFINLKGGVGKTTTAVAVAEILAEDDGRRVLLIDLDPQTNATVTLISEERWAELDRTGRTVAQLFADHLDAPKPPLFDIETAIEKRVSTVGGGIETLDLLASSIQLIDIQDRIPSVAMMGHFNINPLDILRTALRPVIGRYDYVIIDCPPSLGTVTRNGLRISTGYVIPTIPDIVSTWGLYQIVDNVDRFARLVGRPIPALGIVATKVQGNNLHRRVMTDLKLRRLGRFGEAGGPEQPPLFENRIPQSVAVARGADASIRIRTLRGKYGDAYDAFYGLTQEIKTLCETKNP